MLLVIALLAAEMNEARGQMHHSEASKLGVVDFPVTGKPSSQSDFNRAMALLHHMTYPEARKGFQAMANSDSGCAMAYWGVAMTYFQPLWPTRPGPRELQRGWEAIQKAQSVDPPTNRERLLIEATAAFFREPSASEYWKRIHAWAEGIERAFARFPKDHEVGALYALALLATVPPDQVASTNNARAAEILLWILKENPLHPGAMHYLIHANDVPGRERESLEILREYERIAPNNPHALHMPTHIYTRLGDWKASVAGNLKAADAALRFPAGDAGQFVWDEFPHALEYLIYAYLQMGLDDEAAARSIRVLRLELTAWINDLKQTNDSIALMTQAAELETSTPKHAVTPAPTLPAYELLGDLLLGHGKAGEALTAYQRSLETNPLRFNSLLGAAKAAEAEGNRQTAGVFYRQLLAVAGAQSKRHDLQEARDFLAK